MGRDIRCSTMRRHAYRAVCLPEHWQGARRPSRPGSSLVSQVRRRANHRRFYRTAWPRSTLTEQDRVMEQSPSDRQIQRRRRSGRPLEESIPPRTVLRQRTLPISATIRSGASSREPLVRIGVACALPGSGTYHLIATLASTTSACWIIAHGLRVAHRRYLKRIGSSPRVVRESVEPAELGRGWSMHQASIPGSSGPHPQPTADADPLDP